MILLLRRHHHHDYTYKIIYNQQIQKSISESYAEYMAGRSYVYNVARNLDLKVT